MGGGGNPISDAVSAVSNTVNSVVSSVSNTVNATLTNTTEDIARSDVGKAGGAALAPLSAVRSAGEAVVHGDIGGAGKALIGGEIAGNPLTQASNASSDINHALSDPSLQRPTFGYAGDIANAGSVSQRLAQGGPASDADLHALESYQIKSGIAGTAIYGAHAAYGWAAANPAQAATASALANAARSGNVSSIAGQLGAPDYLTNILPDGTRSPDSDLGGNPGLPNTSDPYRAGGAPVSSMPAGLLIAAAAIGAVAFVSMRRR